MHTIDWLIIWGFLIGLVAIAGFTLRYTRSVADFLAANRCAGRYLLTNTNGMVVLGAATVVSLFQVGYENGFTGMWWGNILTPITLIVTLSGWIVYRWRETRILSMAQLFELRYGKSYRIFAGILAFIGGVGGLFIFPTVASNFAVYFMNLPPEFNLLGQAINTASFIAAFLVFVSLLLTFLGGHIAVMITDFFQAILCSMVFLALLFVLFSTFDWNTIVEGLAEAPAEASRLNPFHTSETHNYGLKYYLMTAFFMVFVWPVGGYNQAPNASAVNAHELRMATILGSVRGMLLWTVPVIMPVFAYVIMHHGDFTEIAMQVQNTISAASEQVQRQVLVPVALSHILPVGMIGALSAVMLAAFISTNDSYFHQFGSMFVQDVVLPLRKKPFKPETHIKLLRISIIGVALIVLVGSLLYDQKQDIQMLWGLVASFTAGTIAIPMLGGLYWSRSAPWGCWGSATTGIVLSIAGLVVRREYPEFTLNGQELGLITVIFSAIVFIVLSLMQSLFTNRQPENMDRLLHRGKFKIEDDTTKRYATSGRFLQILGIGDEFSRGDKIIYLGVLGWNIFWFLVFVIGTTANMAYVFSDQSWGKFWQYSMYINLTITFLTTIWLSIGGILDLFKLFKRLKQIDLNVLDDGMVVDGVNLDDLERLSEADLPHSD